MKFSILCFTIQFINVLNFSACHFVVSKQGIQVSYNVTSFGFCQTNGNKIQSFYHISLPDCVIECGLRNHCLALSYHHQMSSCLLLGSMDKNDTGNGKCEYIQRTDILIHALSCENECSANRSVCDLSLNECKPKECDFPSPINSVTLGNQLGIGAKIRYKCYYGTKEVSDIYGATCSEDRTWTHIANCTVYESCDDAFKLGHRRSGVYNIHLTSGGYLTVRCDMSEDNGRWIVIQRRMNDSDFFKTWDEYKDGFGDLNGNFWLGNENIWTLTRQGSWMLRIDLTYNNETGYAEYSSFSIGDEISKYALSIGRYSGNIGDSLGWHNGAPFTTKDRDNDSHNSNCAIWCVGAWWYRYCHKSNLNGIYGSPHSSKGLNWVTWKGWNISMTTTEMKVKQIV